MEKESQMINPESCWMGVSGGRAQLKTHPLLCTRAEPSSHREQRPVPSPGHWVIVTVI